MLKQCDVDYDSRGLDTGARQEDSLKLAAGPEMNMFDLQKHENSLILAYHNISYQRYTLAMP